MPKWTDRIADATARARQSLNDPDAMQNVSDKIRRVAVPALQFTPIEYLLPAAAIAAIIKMADEKGLLESEAARPLKDIAKMVDDQVGLDEQMLLRAVPKLVDLKIVSKVLGDGKAKQSVALLAKFAANSGSVREVIDKFKQSRGPGKSL